MPVPRPDVYAQLGGSGLEANIAAAE